MGYALAFIVSMSLRRLFLGDYSPAVRLRFPDQMRMNHWEPLSTKECRTALVIRSRRSRRADNIVGENAVVFARPQHEGHYLHPRAGDAPGNSVSSNRHRRQAYRVLSVRVRDGQYAALLG